MKKNNQFWISFSDLMTSLFFVMLVLYVLTFLLLEKRNQEYVKLNKNLKNKLNVYESVKSSLDPLKKYKLLKYDESYRRYTLSFDIKFRQDHYKLDSRWDLLNDYNLTMNKIRKVGERLKTLIDNLLKKKQNDVRYKNVSYLLVISGSSSNLPGNDTVYNYILSYKRALSLYFLWKKQGIDFDAEKYHDIIDLQIAGNGIGGVGRFPNNPKNSYASEKRNQRFIINIVPKIGKIENANLNGN